MLDLCSVSGGVREIAALLDGDLWRQGITSGASETSHVRPLTTPSAAPQLYLRKPKGEGTLDTGPRTLELAQGLIKQEENRAFKREMERSGGGGSQNSGSASTISFPQSLRVPLPRFPST